jgi:predicted ribosome quality control (RQC) complex YloA/Tae2 family protein
LSNNPADELAQQKNSISAYEKELADITQKISDFSDHSKLTSNTEELLKIYGTAIQQYQKLVKAYKEYITTLENNI